MSLSARQDVSSDAVIVADVGGTNGRFALAYESGKTHRGYQLENIVVYQNAQFDSFEDLLARYLDALNGTAPKVACFAVAGPINSRVRDGWITNLNWHVDASVLEARFGFDRVTLVNDLSALAATVPQLSEEDVLPLNEVCRDRSGPVSVIGVGTGFGVAVLTDPLNVKTIPTEPGHITFAPSTDLERRLSDSLAPALGRVTVEHVLAASGLARIYRFFADLHGAGEPVLDAADVTRLALEKNDELAVLAVQQFLSILGSVSGEIALTQGARGGVYFCGGVLPRIASLLAASDLMARFIDKEPMRDYLSNIPINLITQDNNGLLGAATLFDF